MKTLLGEVALFNRWTGRFDPAAVFQGLDGANFRDFETLWKPELDRRVAEFSSWTEAAAGNVQDAHWDWVGKAKSEASYESFAVESDGVTQGLMLIDLALHHARLPSQKGLDLCYIELVASAPWNRRGFSDNPKYKGAGRVLLATALSFGIDLELKGRTGLHSLPESETWYEPLGFMNCGFDDEKNLQYFEMTEAAAALFLAEEE